MAALCPAELGLSADRKRAYTGRASGRLIFAAEHGLLHGRMGRLYRPGISAALFPAELHVLPAPAAALQAANSERRARPSWACPPLFIPRWTAGTRNRPYIDSSCGSLVGTIDTPKFSGVGTDDEFGTCQTHFSPLLPLSEAPSETGRGRTV